MATALNGNRMPSLRRQALNLGGALARSAVAGAQGRPVFVPREVLAERERICAGCAENLAGRCRKCGCGVATRGLLLRKTRLARESCPLPEPKWGAWPA